MFERQRFLQAVLSDLDSDIEPHGRLSQDPSCHSFSSSSVMTVTTDGQGRPQVYQASQSTRTAPGGVKETRRSLQDSRSGVQELTIGHHLDERAHIVGRKRNQRTGHEDHNVQFINLDEEEAETFNHEWQQRAQRGMPRPHSMYAALPGRDSSSPLAITARGEASPSFEPYPDQQPRAEAASGRSDHRPKRRTKSKQRPRHETSM
ncbi:hypothetical protein HPB47_024064 [Ixodes persulcatus]|uniref:Uncharacterized protein n=1 Tax=Ixodes persulcatus TaxID=34615 RepID=A0AC60Q7M6_IXOPE|nr:hypothetical protein HPB47_024064 [Ixodes persulcatus]